MDLFEYNLNDKSALYLLIKNSENPQILDIKTELQDMFNNYPESHKRDLRSRFAKADRRVNLGAFFELHQYNWLNNLGFSIMGPTT